jgi:hypothetical protein
VIILLIGVYIGMRIARPVIIEDNEPRYIIERSDEVEVTSNDIVIKNNDKSVSVKKSVSFRDTIIIENKSSDTLFVKTDSMSKKECTITYISADNFIRLTQDSTNVVLDAKINSDFTVSKRDSAGKNSDYYIYKVEQRNPLIAQEFEIKSPFISQKRLDSIVDVTANYRVGKEKKKSRRKQVVSAIIAAVITTVILK